MEKKTITLGETVTVDGKTLKPGKYDVMINGKKATFEMDHQMVASAPCDWKTIQHKSPYDSVVTSSANVLQELDFEGSNQVLEIM